MICSEDVDTPEQLRRAIVRVYKQGFTYEQTASMLGVGRATVNRILRLQRESGDIVRRARGGGGQFTDSGQARQAARGDREGDA